VLPILVIEAKVHTYMFLRQLRTPAMLEGMRSSQWIHPGVRVHIKMVLAPIYHVPVAKRVREGTLLGGTEGAVEHLGPVKVSLEGIPTACADREVRLQPPIQNSPLTNPFSGNYPCDKRGRALSLTYSCVGRPFQFTRQRCGGAVPPGWDDTVCWIPLR
jgi:hypothetical protein